MEKKIQSDKQLILAPRISKFILPSQLTIEEQREIYKGVIKSRKQYEGFPGLDNYFRFDEQKGIKGSNLPYGVLIERELAKQGQRTPTFYEAMQLDKKGLLTKDVYRGYGIAIFDCLNPNKDLAEKVVEQAKQRNYKLPVLAHFSGLDLDKKTGLYKFTDNDFLIIYGDEAVEELENFDYKENSGVRALVRGMGGGWHANGYDLLYSDSIGKVDWKCAEGTLAHLEAKAIQEIEQTVQKQTEEVLARINSKKEAALALLK